MFTGVQVEEVVAAFCISIGS